MKKALLAGLVLLVLSGIQVFAGAPLIHVPYTTSALSVNGNSTDWYGIKSLGKGISFYRDDGHPGTSPSDLGTTICKSMGDETDCRVDLWLAHNGVNLYVLAEVHDDSYEPLNSLSNKAYKEDTLHLYIDSTNSKNGPLSNPIANQYGYEQFGYSTDGNIYGEYTDFNTPGLAHQTAPFGSQPDGTYWAAQCGVNSLSGGGYLYVFEESVKLSGYPGRNMAAMTPGNSYGFNAEFCDADYGMQLQGFIFWSSDGFEDAWDYENLWGTMVLEPTPEPSSFILLATGLMMLPVWRWMKSRKQKR